MTLKHIGAAFYGVLLSVVLGACTSVPHTSGPASTVRADANQMLTGRMVVNVAPHGADPARTLNAHFELRGHAQRGALDLSTPLGSLLAQARWEPDGAWLHTPRGKTRFANLNALTRQMLGETLPLSALFDWLRGQPWADAPYQGLAIPESGFSQMGWRVDLTRWAESVVVATRLQAPDVTIRVKLDER